jgi:hypothetical protein
MAGSLPANPQCFDALVSASIVQQTPTAYPECGDDCIVTSWPWIVQMDVKHVLRGRATLGRLTVLKVQHTDFPTNRTHRWWLRRNDIGGFNILFPNENANPPRCARAAKPAEPYFRPPQGKTLDDVAAEGLPY